MNLVLSLSSALLLILIFPRFDLTWLAPVALAPLLIACAREFSWKKRFLYGWAAGFVFWFGICYWIQFVLQVHGGLSFWLSWTTFFLFAILKGLHLAIFAALAGFLMYRWWAIPAVAALWTGIERTHGTFGFAWLDLGNAGINMPLAMRLAPVTGVYGLSFVFAAIACAVALIVVRRPRRELAWLAALLVIPILPALPAPAAPTAKVQVVQPDIDTEADWTTASLAQEEREMAALSRDPGVPLIVWPEAPAPFYPSDPSFRGFVGYVARDSHSYLLFGGVGRTPQGAPLNSAFLVGPDGNILDRYDKIKLVPFGEFVPPPFGWVNRITHEAGDFVPGSRIVVFPVDGHRVGTFICYESAFPNLVRQFARGGAQVLMNLSNDGYFGKSAAREQHLELVRMRAAENRRWILRATNDGITAMIDPRGRVTDVLQPYHELAAAMQYGYVSQVTPYAQYGDLFAWGCLIVGLGAVAGTRFRKIMSFPHAQAGRRSV
ncbi:MAG TPA: apolipoprotein N-acyltransferase [Bryobacteraceae bacterium]|nr:apolipoprotein N-acyltransferase [Bryobacteraceae bacterium]